MTAESPPPSSADTLRSGQLASVLDQTQCYLPLKNVGNIAMINPMQLQTDAYTELRAMVQDVRAHATGRLASLIASTSVGPGTSSANREIHDAASGLMKNYWAKEPSRASEGDDHDCIWRLLKSVCPPEANMSERLRTSPTVIEALGLSRLRKVLPDFAVGVRHEFIKIQKDPQSESKVPTEFLIFLNDIYMSINNTYYDIPMRACLHYIFVEAKSASGNRAEARLQNLTAMRLGLGIYLELHRRAKAANFDDCMDMPDCTRQCFGIVTSVELWQIFVMVASETARGDIEFAVASVWVGNMADPVDVAQYVEILQQIAATAKERTVAISNWLWCVLSNSEDEKTLALAKNNVYNSPDEGDQGALDCSASSTSLPRREKVAKRESPSPTPHKVSKRKRSKRRGRRTAADAKAPTLGTTERSQTGRARAASAAESLASNDA